MISNFFKGFKQGLKDFSLVIASITNFILLFITYFIGVGLTSIFAKLFGKHFLDLKINERSETYWEDLDKKYEENNYRQF